MIVLDNVAKQFGVNENFQPFTEKVQTVFDELKEKFPNIIRIKIFDAVLLLEKEENGMSGIVEEMELPLGLQELIEESFIPDPVEISQIEEVSFEEVPLDAVIVDGVNLDEGYVNPPEE